MATVLCDSGGIYLNLNEDYFSFDLTVYNEILGLT